MKTEYHKQRIEAALNDGCLTLAEIKQHANIDWRTIRRTMEDYGCIEMAIITLSRLRDKKRAESYREAVMTVEDLRYKGVRVDDACAQVGLTVGTFRKYRNKLGIERFENVRL